MNVSAENSVTKQVHVSKNRQRSKHTDEDSTILKVKYLIILSIFCAIDGTYLEYLPHLYFSINLNF